jgi:hypothetical protein
MALFPLPDNNLSAPAPRLGTEEQTSVNITKTAFEANYLQVRRTSSRARKAFNLKYDNVTTDEFAILEDFFNQWVGNVFTFVHPITSVSYQCTFKEGTLSKTFVSYGVYSTSIALESI